MAAPNPKEALIALIADTFTVETLRAFVRRGPSGAEIEGLMSWEWAGLKVLAKEFLEESEKQDALDAGLAARLLVHLQGDAERLATLSGKIGHPWQKAPNVRSTVLADFLFEAMEPKQLTALLGDLSGDEDVMARRWTPKTHQSVFARDHSGRINANFFQTLLTLAPEHEAGLARIAALWDITLQAPAPPPPSKAMAAQQFAQSAQPIAPVEAPPPPSPHPAVLVLGSASNFPEHVAQAAQAVGQAVADLKLTLLTGDSSGVDLGVARAFANRSRALGQDLRLLKIVTPSWPATFEGGETLRRPDAAEESVRRASVVVLFDGGEGTEQMLDIARRLGRPVLPLAATGPLAQRVFSELRQAGAFPGRLSAQDFAALQDLPRPERFASVLARALPRAARRPAPEQPRRAHLTADQPELHEDKLNLAEQAHIFAEALSAREVKPPLAIGLLGEWGSGKSFFMRQIQADVRALSGGRDPAFYRNVCQIIFNAWHYVDANPWASLAGRIFDGIAEHVFGDAQEQLEEKRRLLRASLASTEVEERAAREAQVEWEGRLDDARQRLLTLEKAQEAYVRSARLLLDRRVWEEMSARGSVGTLRGKAEEAAEALGLDLDIPDEETTAEFEKLQAQVEKARVAAAQVRAVPGALGALGALRRPRGPLEWALIGLVLLGGVAVSVLLTVFEQDWWHQVATLLAQVVLIMGFVGERAWKLVQASRAIVGFVEAADAEAEAIRQAILDDPPQELIDARAAVALAETEAEAARLVVADIEQRLTETRQQIADIHAGKLAYDFIRGAGQGYLSEQGIVSKVRRDLETLEDRLADWQRAAEGRDARSPDPPPIDRIILYIDDLDRCRPSQVVQVLQAVHLLLAKPLFMVVVGVDPRWLERSLESEYRELLTGGGGGAGAPPAASPRDYLEKIFQVPYTLPSVDAAGFQGLVDHLLPSREEVEAEEAAQAEAAPVEAEAAETEATETEATETEATETEATETDAPPEAPDGPTSEDDEDDFPSVPRFFIEAWEREHLHALSSLVGTPRDILRFINIYRLLRISAPDPAAFAADRPDAEHRAAQLLLALNVGCPELAAVLLDLLAKPRRLQRVMGAAPQRWTDVVDALEPYPDGEPSRSPLVATLTERTPLAHRQLERAWPLLRDLSPEHPSSLKVWQRWAARVSRYSFLAGR